MWFFVHHFISGRSGRFWLFYLFRACYRSMQAGSLQQSMKDLINQYVRVQQIPWTPWGEMCGVRPINGNWALQNGHDPSKMGLRAPIKSVSQSLLWALSWISIGKTWQNTLKTCIMYNWIYIHIYMYIHHPHCYHDFILFARPSAPAPLRAHPPSRRQPVVPKFLLLRGDRSEHETGLKVPLFMRTLLS